MGVRKIGEYLVEENICKQDEVQAALEEQAVLRKEGVFKPLGTVLIDSIGVTVKDLDRCLKKMHIDILAQTSFFDGLSQDILEKTVAIAEQQILPENKVVFEKGDRADTFCIVVSGKVKVYLKSVDDTENILATLFPGDGFGEMALLTGEPRSASIKTLEATSLLLLSKNYFEQLCDLYPEISRAFIKIIASRLSSGNKEILNSAETARAYQHLVSTQTEVSFHPFVGQSKAIKKIINQIAVAAANIDPVLLSSEVGLMKLALAKAIHKDSIYAQGPFLSINAKSAALDSISNIANASTEGNLQLELAQCTSLFGHEQDAMPFVKTKRLGVLQVCHDGTVVIQNIDRLTSNVQEQLHDYLQTGFFKTIGGHTNIPSGARIIATTHKNLEALVKEGKFSKKLFDRLRQQEISIPPLRRRKGDLKEIAQSMIEHFNGPAGKSVKGIENDAYQRIMSYNWPENMSELEVVIRRAVNLAQHDMLTVEDIFIGLAPAQGKHTVNLLNFDFVRNIFSHKSYPLVLQIGTAALFAALFLMAFLGSQSPDENITLILVWAIWWPMLAVSWFIGARVWCSVCPMGAANDLLSRCCSFKCNVPKFVRDKGLYLSAFGLCTIIWVEAAANMPYSPKATGFLLLSILSFAILSGLFFERRLWCRYLCPLGRLAAIFSGCSVVEWRSNLSICNNTCMDNYCYKGRDGMPGCPLYQGPFSLRSNQNCILCGICVKNCENMSPAFNLRSPGRELWAVVKPEKVTSVFVPVIIGTQLFRMLEHKAVIHHLSETMGQGWLVLAGLMAVSVFSAFLYIQISGNLAFDSLTDKTIKKRELFNYAIIPLSFGFELGYQFGPLLSRIGHFFPVLGRQLGVNLEFLDFSRSLGSALPWQLFFIILGSGASLFILVKFICNRQTATNVKLNWQNGLPLALLTFLYLFLFIAA